MTAMPEQSHPLHALAQQLVCTLCRPARRGRAGMHARPGTHLAFPPTALTLGVGSGDDAREHLRRDRSRPDCLFGHVAVLLRGAVGVAAHAIDLVHRGDERFAIVDVAVGAYCPPLYAARRPWVAQHTAQRNLLLPHVFKFAPATTGAQASGTCAHAQRHEPPPTCAVQLAPKLTALSPAPARQPSP